VSDSFLPPVVAELGGNADGFLKTLTKAVSSLDRFATAAKAAGTAAEAAFAKIEAGAAPLAAIAESAAAAKKEMQGFSRANNAVARSSGKAAVAVDAGMNSMAASAERMATAVGTSVTTTGTGIAGLGTEARATATGLRATSTQSAAAGAGMARAGAQSESLGMKLLGLGPIFDKVKKWGTLGLAGVGIAAVVLSSTFQTQMTRLSTAAGAPIAQVQAMRGEVLKTATSVGESGTKMAEALYHPVSAGLSLKTSLAAVKYAAEEAQISGASLDDTTYSLSSVMKAFNLSAANAGPTMADLNAIVGQGDMRFQDFNASVKNWAPTAAQMGISINSMGAGLAYLTDRGNSAEVAATRMTMGISMMTTPSAKATKMLTAMGAASTDVSSSSAAMKKAMEDSGITQNRLAADLKKPDGLYVALNDLKGSLEKAGVSGTEADSVLSKIFGGGRSDKAIMSLMQNLDGLKGKFGDIQKASNMKNFDAAWEKTTKTLKYQFDQIKAGAENLGIRLGDVLVPQVSKFLDLLEKRGAPVAKSISAAFSGIASGFSGSAGKQAKTGRTVTAAGGQTASGGQQHGGMIAPPPSLTGWQKAGQAIRGVAQDFTKFASEAVKAWVNLQSAQAPAYAMLAGLLLGALKAVGAVLATVVGPALVAVTGFLDHHQTVIQTVVLALVIYKAMMLSTTAVTKGIEVATKAWAAAQAALNAVMDANPVTLIIIGLAALIAVIVMIATKTTWFQTAWKVTWSAIQTAAGAAWGFLKSVFGHITDAVNTVVGFVRGHWPLLLGILTGPIGIAVLVITRHWKQISGAFETAYRAVVGTAKKLVTWVTGLPGKILTALASLGGRLYTWASNAFGKAKSAAATKAGDIIKWLDGLPAQLVSALGDLSTLLWNAGTNLITGFIGGIESMAGNVKSTLGSLTSKLTSWKGPPAKDRVLLTGAGQMIIDGLVNGMQSRFASVKDSAAAVAQATVSSFSAELGIASPSRKFAQLGGYVIDGLVSGLTGSTARVRAATEHLARSLYVDFGSSHKALQRGVAKDNSELMSLASRRDSVASRLKAAQKSLAAAQKSWASERSSVASGIMQGASIITASPDEGRAVNTSDVLANMRAQVQANSQFASELNQLRKKGLNSGLISQLASAGVDQAGATALALSAGSKSQIQQMNSMQASLQGAANSTGSAVADSMYGAGIKSAQGLVKGLKSQEKAIDAQMLRIAKSMQAAIKKALGIHSPSQVFAALGQFIPQGLAQGIASATHHATTAVSNLAGAVTGAGAIGAGGMALAGAGGGTTVINNVYITVEGNVTSDRKLIDTIQQGMLRLGMRNPSTYPGYKR
jgi:TP901 family phage tail tape measure protein